MPVLYGGEWINPGFSDEVEIAGPNIRSRLMTRLEKFSRKDIGVLILGETGTGKELIANYIHAHSTRQGKAFLSLQWLTIPI
ncbi:MAG: sigma 54-interacting transcriptional regulator [Candidatus Woesearchaeota archaeon]|jgi:DNA-binding NtrC family response regulator|nr:sigma 54-interacting transcriptional regulator [Candidatus Woesearchaeota archaeon]